MNVTISADTKDALARDIPEAAHCREALLRGLAYYGSAKGDGATHFRTQRPAVARLFHSLLGERGGSIRKHQTPRLYRSAAYDIAIPAELAGVPKRPSARCDRRMEVRAAFLGCGSLASPAHGYHLEFVFGDEARATRITGLLTALGFPPKRALRKGKTLLYYKDAEAIVGVLTVAGAYSAVLHMEDVRAMKETKNRIHRLVNTEAANVDRAAGAAAAQREAIAYLVDAYGLRNLSPVLREAAQLRLAHPEETLAELGKRCRPPVGKSTINGRIATLVRLVRRLRSPGKNREGSKSAAGKHEPAHL